jgi:hypothetical protein
VLKGEIFIKEYDVGRIENSGEKEIDYSLLCR